MTKSQIAAVIAEKAGITKKQAMTALETVTQLAYKQAKHSFTVPGLGKLVLVNRPAREMTMQFGPNKGKMIKIPARRVVKFRVAKAVKDALLGSKGIGGKYVANYGSGGGPAAAPGDEGDRTIRP